MPNWAESMQETYEYYEVDPATWGDMRRIDNVKNCTINRDDDTETLESATIDVVDSVGECYIRAYLITIQNGIREKFPLGTFLVQTPASNFNGKTRNVSMDAYSPLLELKENPPPLGYFVPKGANIMDEAGRCSGEHARAPIVVTACDKTLDYDFIANTNDNWLTFNRDLIANARYRFALDEMGRILFAPNQDTASLQPVWTYDDGNSSILYPEISMQHDLYGIPNVVEVIYANGSDYFYSRVVNDDENSPISTVNRGREIIYRVTDPSLNGNSTQPQIDEYANQLLRELSTLEYTITYSHGYCPVRVGDCVRLNYAKADLKNVKAKVISQTINCKPGCKVTEKAVFTKKLWR